MDVSRFSQPVQTLWKNLSSCTLCPRRCSVNRLSGQLGYCGIGSGPVISSWGPHFGEESVLVGRSGSGTVFLTGCNLKCIFCQNYDISHYRQGRACSIDELAEIFFRLQESGCININLVTPTHQVAVLAAALETARQKGLRLPIVYNTGGYDSVRTLELLEGLIDIYMPDMKYADPDIAGRLSDAPDYPQINQAAVKEMHRQVGDLQIAGGIATRGLLVRHLVLPENLAGSERTFDFLADQISPRTAVNVMDQYRPCFHASAEPQLNRRLSSYEFNEALSYAKKKRLHIIC